MGKLNDLQKELEKLGRVAVAYSSGVDSTFLLLVAVNTLGRENVLAITASSCSIPRREIEESRIFCEQHKIEHIILDFDILGVDGIEKNPVNRCYLCKKELFSQIIQVAKDNSFSYVIEGSNADDVRDYRPGMKAIEELGVISPLKECGLTKDAIRTISKEMSLETWKKPSFACLASRVVYGENLTKEKLSMVESAEEKLLDLGIEQFRVRVHGNENYLARIEVGDEDIEKLAQREVRESITSEFKEMGFSFVSLDLQGYKMGNMNQNVKK